MQHRPAQQIARTRQQRRRSAERVGALRLHEIEELRLGEIFVCLSQVAPELCTCLVCAASDERA
jgi:hypothetical protein